MACRNQFIAIYELWIDLANKLLNMNEFVTVDQYIGMFYN